MKDERNTITDGFDGITVPMNLLIEQLRILGIFDDLRVFMDALASMGKHKMAPDSAEYKAAVNLYAEKLPLVRVLAYPQEQTKAAPAPKKETGLPVTKCKGCGAEIVWMATTKGKQCPVNAATAGTDKIFNPDIHTTHFLTCTKAGEFRKPKPTNPQAHTEATADLFMNTR